MNGEVYVLTKNNFPWVDKPAEILLATSDENTVFGFEVDKVPLPDRGNLKIDVWRDGEIHNVFLWIWDLGMWVEQRYPETKKAQERRKEWQKYLGIDA